VFDQLDQLVNVVPLVSGDASGKRTWEAGLKELRSAPLSQCPQIWALRWHVPRRLRLLRHVVIRKSAAERIATSRDSPRMLIGSRGATAATILGTVPGGAAR
jgi:hypothetical protein